MGRAGRENDHRLPGPLSLPARVSAACLSAAYGLALIFCTWSGFVDRRARRDIASRYHIRDLDNLLELNQPALLQSAVCVPHRFACAKFPETGLQQSFSGVTPLAPRTFSFPAFFP